MIDDEFPFLPRGSEVWIAPIKEQSGNLTKFWLFRAKNMSQALVRRAVIDGDQYALVPVNAARKAPYDSVVYNPEQDGEVLGVVQDTVQDIENSTAVFWRSRQ